MKKADKQKAEGSIAGKNTVKADFTQMQQYVKQLEEQIKLLGETIRSGRAIS